MRFAAGGARRPARWRRSTSLSVLGVLVALGPAAVAGPGANGAADGDATATATDDCDCDD